MAKASLKAVVKTLDEDPYAFSIAHAPLTTLRAPTTRLSVGSSALGEPVAASEVLAEPVAAQAPTVEPPRTDVHGQGDGSMKVERVTVTGSMKPIPHTAPNLSREQTASMVCRAARFGGRWLDRTKLAYRRTLDAYDMRQAYEAGAATLAQSNNAELKRQEAVNAAVGSGFFFGLVGGNVKKTGLPKPVSGSLVLENVDLFTFSENGKDVMAVSGVVRNTGVSESQVPPLTLQAIDQWDFVLAGQSSLLPFITLAPGTSKSFEVRFLNPPDTTDEVYVHFAPPFNFRARRDCEALDPSSIDAAMSDPEPSDQPTGPTHSPGELNALSLTYRREAEAAWECRDGRNTPLPSNLKSGLNIAASGGGERRGLSVSFGQPNMEEKCKPYEGRLRWRDLFQMAEAADEAWSAAVALESGEKRLAAGSGSAEEVRAAQRAEAEAAERLRSLAQAGLERIGAPAPEVVVELDTSTFAHEKAEGRWLDIAGRIINTGALERQVDALMLAIVDRLGFPITSISLDKGLRLKPGETVTFKDKIVLSNDSVRRFRQTDAPNWQVRVGAIGK
jgi:hypothetical protein